MTKENRELLFSYTRRTINHTRRDVDGRSM